MVICQAPPVVTRGGRGRAGGPALLLLLLLHAFVFGPAVLEPDLDDPHVQPRLLGQLLPDVPRGLGALAVGVAEGLQLLGRYCRSRSLLVSICGGGWGRRRGEREERNGMWLQ